jgi:hypothetical protein
MSINAIGVAVGTGVGNGIGVAVGTGVGNGTGVGKGIGVAVGTGVAVGYELINLENSSLIFLFRSSSLGPQEIIKKIVKINIIFFTKLKPAHLF